MDRRQFVVLMAGAFLQPTGSRPGLDMVVRSARPEDLEMPLSGFVDYITPVERFFVRSHTYTPRVAVGEWRLQVDGDVATPLTLSMDDLKRLPAFDVVGVLECAGNGRGFYEPSVPGLQWTTGGVGNGRWRGVRLADVLEQAGVRESAKEILFNGADVPLGAMADFARSIPIAKARDTRTLLAYEMNGETLPVKHGFPLRLVVPGWVGAAWVKWVTSISALDREHDGFWMKRAYRHPVAPLQPGTAVAPEQMRPVTSLVVKSVIAAPVDGSQVVRGKPVTVRGVAWSGDVGPVIRVEVSVDAGRSWRAATLRHDQRTSFGWRQWEYTWTPDREAFHTILARARDAAGNTQPFDQEWNPSGYAWNVVPRVGVNVAKDASSHERTPASAPVSAAAVAPPASYKGSCLVCHDADVIEQQRLTRPQWDAEINKMTGWGAQVADADRRALLDYLANAFGPRLRRAP